MTILFQGTRSSGLRRDEFLYLRGRPPSQGCGAIRADEVRRPVVRYLAFKATVIRSRGPQPCQSVVVIVVNVELRSLQCGRALVMLEN